MKNLAMPQRTKLCLAFSAGGLFTFFALLVLQGLGQSQAGMGDGAVQTSESGDFVSMFLICAYFGASAVGICVSKSKLSLWLSAAFAHCLLLAAYTLMFVATKNSDPDGFKWHDQVTIRTIVMAAYFSPWMFAWAVVLL